MILIILIYFRKRLGRPRGLRNVTTRDSVDFVTKTDTWIRTLPSNGPAIGACGQAVAAHISTTRQALGRHMCRTARGLSPAEERACRLPPSLPSPAASAASRSARAAVTGGSRQWSPAHGGARAARLQAPPPNPPHQPGQPAGGPAPPQPPRETRRSVAGLGSRRRRRRKAVGTRIARPLRGTGCGRRRRSCSGDGSGSGSELLLLGAEERQLLARHAARPHDAQPRRRLAGREAVPPHQVRPGQGPGRPLPAAVLQQRDGARGGGVGGGEEAVDRVRVGGRAWPAREVEDGAEARANQAVLAAVAAGPDDADAEGGVELCEEVGGEGRAEVAGDEAAGGVAAVGLGGAGGQGAGAGGGDDAAGDELVEVGVERAVVVGVLVRVEGGVVAVDF